MIFDRENGETNLENSLSPNYTVCNSWLKIFESWNKFCLVMKHRKTHFSRLGRATTKVWLFLWFWVFPCLISNLQVGSCYGGFEILMGFKNFGVFV